ncbi:hypothetical protein LOZ16_002060 [Ophidiomyces ophidiicola]|nr:hypothetical protein LOZ16_002060 [Ophidiomyces ophidiicola]
MSNDLISHRPELFLEGPSDPDAQATITDFIDYTEYLPSDLVRSLTLVRNLDKKYLDAANAVHELTRIYGQLPELSPKSRPDPHTLRIQISQQLKRAINAREASFAEASRLYDAVDRHFDRLGSIKSKLGALAITTARELEAQAKNPPVTYNTEKVETPTRLTLRLDGGRQKSRVEKVARSSRLTSLNPSHLTVSVEGASNEAHVSALGEDSLKKNTAQPKKTLKNGIKLPGTRTHKNVPERSTSKVLAALPPPPPNAELGGEHRPWLRLTEWEMAILRKKMKKNSVWQPSDVMILRELGELGRGWDNYRAAKEKAEQEGAEFLDCDDVMNTYVPGKLTRKADAVGGTGTVEETKLVNRGMKMNEARKLKRESQAREQAAQAAAEAESAAKRLSDIGSTFKSLFSNPFSQRPLDTSDTGSFGVACITNGITVKPRPQPTGASRKRKLEESEALAQPENTEHMTTDTTSARTSTKKPKLTKPMTIADDTTVVEPTSIKTSIPIASAAPVKEAQEMPPAELERPVTRSGRRPSTSKGQPTFTPPNGLRSTRHRSATAGPTEAATRESIRRKSMTPGKAITVDASALAPATTAAGRRSRRPAPGPVTAGQDGGSAVSVGRRKAKPTKKRKDLNGRDGNSQTRDDYRIDEDGVMEEIDPNEPRYCLCGDVSFGTMICCEDNDDEDGGGDDGFLLSSTNCSQC